MKEFAEPIINRPVDDSLVLWFTGRGSRREGTLLADLSKKGHHGTLTGTYAWKNTPLGHSVLDVVTDGYVSVADHADFTFGNGTSDSPFSISAWINMDSAANFPIVSKSVAAGDNDEWAFRTIASKLYLVLYKSDASAFEGRLYNTALSAGQWCHVVATYNGVGGTSADAGIRLYIDGVRKDDTSVAGGTYVAMDGTTAPVHIGLYYTTYADGKINDTRIYRKELTSKEAMEIFNQTKHFYGK